MAYVHSDPQRDVVALGEVRRSVKKFVLTNLGFITNCVTFDTW